MPNKAEYAKNFEAVTNRPPRQSQVLTVFLNQMSEDRKTGEEIATNEYLEVFLIPPAPESRVVVQLRRDHGAYWLLSRETFVRVPGVNLDSVDPERSGLERYAVVEALRNEIDTTRHLLSQLVAR